MLQPVLNWITKCCPLQPSSIKTCTNEICVGIECDLPSSMWPTPKTIYISMQIIHGAHSRSRILIWTWHGVFSCMKYEHKNVECSHNNVHISFYSFFYQKFHIKKFSGWSAGALLTKFFWERNRSFAKMITDRRSYCSRKTAAKVNDVFLCTKLNDYLLIIK